MSSPDALPPRRPDAGPDAEDDQPTGGVNLVLIYSLLALALVVSVVVAVFIVLPFYQRR
ncbi:MAG: hypothetical protein WBF42_09530 [Terracidiphilus sp.]